MRGWRLARRPGLGPGGVVSQGPPPVPLPASGGPRWAAPRLRRPGHTSSFPEKVRWAGRLPVPKPQPARVRTRVPARGFSQSQQRRNPRTPPRPHQKERLPCNTEPRVFPRAPRCSWAGLRQRDQPTLSQLEATTLERTALGPRRRPLSPQASPRPAPTGRSRMRAAPLFAGGRCAPAHTCAGVCGAPSSLVSGKFLPAAFIEIAVATCAVKLTTSLSEWE